MRRSQLDTEGPTVSKTWVAVVSPGLEGMPGVRQNAASPWVQLISDGDEAYYYNEQTDETTWDEPAEGVSEFRGKEDDELEQEQEQGQGEVVNSAVGLLLAEDPQSGLPAAFSQNRSSAELSPNVFGALLGGHGGGANVSTADTDEPSRVSELADENSGLKLRLKALEVDAARNAAQSADLQRQVQDHTAALKKSHERESELQSRLGQLQSEHTLLVEQARGAASESERARAADAATHASEVQELHAQSDYATTQVQRLQGERSELKKEVTRLESRLAEEISRAAAAVARSHQNDAASATLDVKVAEAAELREALSQCEALVETQRSKASAVAAERDALGAEVAELRSTAAATADLRTAELHNARTQAQVAENAAEEAAQALSQAIAEKTSAVREVESLRAHLLKGTALIARQQKALDRLAAVGSTAAARSASHPSRGSARKRGKQNASPQSAGTKQQQEQPNRRRPKEKQQFPTSSTRSKSPTGSAARKSAASRAHNRPLNMFAREEERRKERLQREDEKRAALALAETEGCTFKPDLSVSARKKPAHHHRTGSAGRGKRSGTASGPTERGCSDDDGETSATVRPGRTASVAASHAIAASHAAAVMVAAAPSSRTVGSPESQAPLGGKLIVGESEWTTFGPLE